jgi:hypothetical protein
LVSLAWWRRVGVAVPEGFARLLAIVLVFWAVVGFTLWMAWG